MSQYGPVKGRSVPWPRATRNCSGVSCARHSASVFVIFVLVSVDMSVSSSQRFGARWRARGVRWCSIGLLSG